MNGLVAEWAWDGLRWIRQWLYKELIGISKWMRQTDGQTEIQTDRSMQTDRSSQTDRSTQTDTQADSHDKYNDLPSAVCSRLDVVWSVLDFHNALIQSALLMNFYEGMPIKLVQHSEICNEQKDRLRATSRQKRARQTFT